MNKQHYSFDLSNLSVTETEAFAEASPEELRVLLALIEARGEADSEELATLSRTSHARAMAAVVFWEGAGVLHENKNPTVRFEYKERAERTDVYAPSRRETADTIRKNGLRYLIEEFSGMLGKPTLSDSEIHKITALSSEWALSEEYIFTLASYLLSKGTFTVTRLYNKAEELVKQKIDTPALLNDYIKDTESEAGYMRELRRTLGIKNRALSPSEKELFSRWASDFGFSTEIIGEAYDITVMNTGERSLSYMDTILTRWHDGGCKTVSDCRALSERDRAAKTEKRREAGAGNPQKKKKSEEPKFVSFDPAEALKRALERSYGNIPGETPPEEGK